MTINFQSLSFTAYTPDRFTSCRYVNLKDEDQDVRDFFEVDSRQNDQRTKEAEIGAAVNSFFKDTKKPETPRCPHTGRIM